ncbi:molybdopterin-binding protein [Caloranaerobacter sp. TR13]|uniref:molybdopterin-binding protein n=1 Tax=Caloranaerobacter sp. TR13 TaxID=1302151 RepID=UPI0006D3F635|nr:molybdopterin-binding protein [Caloranaerobacter sp. TR13]KPU27592.1 molybdopterin-binding protein [Caloranaerobacter sp. TR13]
MIKVKVEDAVGMVLGHDLTKIVPGKFKGAAFKKGHIIKEDDIKVLKDMGKNHIYVLDLKKGYLHEDEAAKRISELVAGEGLYFTGPSEGKINIKAKYRGLLKVNIDVLSRVNNIDMVILATLHNNTLVERDTTVAGTRIIPLVIEEEKIRKVEEIAKKHGEVLSIRRLKKMNVGIVVTGTEVYQGRIEDKFGPVLKEKLKKYDCNLIGIKYAPDDPHMIKEATQRLVDEGSKVILVSGGMSVDADDVTPNAIRDMADTVITYGSPVLPGAMFMLAYVKDITLIGIPACGMYHKTTIFDLVFPRIIIEEKLTKKDIISLAHGGLCLGCEICKYPICPFGK